MKNAKVKHYALIPAKAKSGRCPNKNWKKFIGGMSLVDFNLSLLPRGLFEKVIVSTDKKDYRPPRGVLKHDRPKELAARSSCVKDVMQMVIDMLQMESGSYLWLLNPTSPFRSKKNYSDIRAMISKSHPDAVVSAVKLHPFIWKDLCPTFKTVGKRKNTEDFMEEYHVENGMFYVVKAGYFRRTNSWYGRNVRLYEQSGVLPMADIDTESDFAEAQVLGKLWKRTKR